MVKYDSFLCLKCLNHTPLIERECPTCQSEKKKADKQKRTESWESMTDDQRADYKFNKFLSNA